MRKVILLVVASVLLAGNVYGWDTQINQYPSAGSTYTTTAEMDSLVDTINYQNQMRSIQEFTNYMIDIASGRLPPETSSPEPISMIEYYPSSGSTYATTDDMDSLVDTINYQNQMHDIMTFTNHMIDAASDEPSYDFSSPFGRPMLEYHSPIR